MPSAPQPFRLQCFDQAPAGVAVQGEVERRGERLRVHYRVLDPQGLLRIPAPAQAADPRQPAVAPQRCDELWTTTCLELFLAEEGATPYWEVNLAPSGNWNLYRLSAYRQNLTPEPAVASLPFDVAHPVDGLSLALNLDLRLLLPPGRPLELALSAVLEDKAGAITYWALHHPAAQADFHRREGFAMRV